MKRPVIIFWNCCQGSKYVLLVRRTTKGSNPNEYVRFSGNFVHVAQTSGEHVKKITTREQITFFSNRRRLNISSEAVTHVATHWTHATRAQVSLNPVQSKIHGVMAGHMVSPGMTQNRRDGRARAARGGGGATYT